MIASDDQLTKNFFSHDSGAHSFGFPSGEWEAFRPEGGEKIIWGGIWR